MILRCVWLYNWGNYLFLLPLKKWQDTVIARYLAYHLFQMDFTMLLVCFLIGWFLESRLEQSSASKMSQQMSPRSKSTDSKCPCEFPFTDFYKSERAHPPNPNKPSQFCAFHFRTKTRWYQWERKLQTLSFLLLCNPIAAQEFLSFLSAPAAPRLHVPGWLSALRL